MPTPSIKSLDRVIPKNPKYENVRTKVNSGWNMRKVMEREEGPTFARNTRKNEFFKRIKPTTIHKLLADNADDDESVYHLDNLTIAEEGPSANRTAVVEATATTDTEKPYLILDLRSEEEYETCHIPDARSFPAVKLNRASNFLTREILAYKNQEDKFIIVYDYDERTAIPAANNLVEQQRIDNVYLLSGGLKEYGAKFPAFVSGEMPEPPRTAQSTKSSASRVPIGGRAPAPRAPGSMSSRVSTISSSTRR